MLVFKLEDQTMDEVTRIFETLQSLIPLDIYKNLFQVILTDNGHEFFDVNNIECIHSTGEYVTHIFLGDPHASRQIRQTNCHKSYNLFYVGIVHLVFKKEQFLHFLT